MIISYYHLKQEHLHLISRPSLIHLSHPNWKYHQGEISIEISHVNERIYGLEFLVVQDLRASFHHK